LQEVHIRAALAFAAERDAMTKVFVHETVAWCKYFMALDCCSGGTGRLKTAWIMCPCKQNRPSHPREGFNYMGLCNATWIYHRYPGFWFFIFPGNQRLPAEGHTAQDRKYQQENVWNDITASQGCYRRVRYERLWVAWNPINAKIISDGVACGFYGFIVSSISLFPARYPLPFRLFLNNWAIP
jgi:hypothetical protein